MTDTIRVYYDDYIETTKKAKKYDEVECALTNIKAEIETLNPVDYVSMSSYEGHRGASDMKEDVLQIIDKYSGVRE